MNRAISFLILSLVASAFVHAAEVEPEKVPYDQTEAYKLALIDVKDTDIAVDEAPRHYIAPDPETLKKLSTHLTLDAKERFLKQVLDWLSEQVNTPIVCDMDWDSHPKVTIDVKDKSVTEILDLLMKQIKIVKLDYLVRGRAVLVTRPERVAKLKEEPKK